MDLLTCTSISSSVTSVTYNQFGSNFYDAYTILSKYYLLADCGNYDPSVEACFPSQGFLSTSGWSNVLEIKILDGFYISSIVTTDFSTFTYSFPAPSTSQSSLIVFSSILALLLVLFFL